MAVIEDDVHVVSVFSTINVEALASVVSDVLHLSSVPSDLVLVNSSVRSYGNSSVDDEALANLVGDY